MFILVEASIRFLKKFQPHLNFRMNIKLVCDLRRRRKKRNSQDSGSISGASQTSGGPNIGKPPRKAGQKVRINETNNESVA